MGGFIILLFPMGTVKPLLYADEREKCCGAEERSQRIGWLKKKKRMEFRKARSTCVHINGRKEKIIMLFENAGKKRRKRICRHVTGPYHYRAPL